MVWPLLEEMISTFWIFHYIAFQNECIFQTKSHLLCIFFKSVHFQKYHDISLLRQKSNAKKNIPTNLSIKNLIYKCKQDQLGRYQYSHLVSRLGDCGQYLSCVLDTCVFAVLEGLRKLFQKKKAPFLADCLNVAGELEVTALEFINRESRKQDCVWCICCSVCSTQEKAQHLEPVPLYS